MATYLGIPVSTTHTITGAIVGVGAARGVSAVRWNVAQDIVDGLGHHHSIGGPDRGRGPITWPEPSGCADGAAAAPAR